MNQSACATLSRMSQIDVLSSGEAYRRLGIARSTFNKHVRAGLIPYVHKLPGTAGYLFDAAEIDALAKVRADDEAL